MILVVGFAEDGEVIESGWLSFRACCLPDSASAQQVRDMRYAFYCGALVMFSGLTNIIPEGVKPDDFHITEAMRERFDRIRNELERFEAEMNALAMKDRGEKAH